MTRPLSWVPQPDIISERKAAAVLRRAVALRPDDQALTLRLARLLYLTDGQQEIVGLLAPVVARADAPAEACFHYGRAIRRLGDPVAAIAALRRAGDDGETAGHLASALRDAGETDAALACAREALARHPDVSRCLTVASRILLSRGETRALLDLCRDLRARGGRNGTIAAMLAIAAWAEGTPEYTPLLDRAQWFEEAHAVEDTAFNAVLANEILGNPVLGRGPGYKATSGDGARIDNLGLRGGPCAQALLAEIRGRIEAYAAMRTIDLPDAVTLVSWALVLRGGGHERWHIHAAARISGVYYAAVPPMGDAPQAGEIGFGPLRAIAERDMSGFPSWTVKPRPGTLLLFPSHFAHRTWPTDVQTPRISVAFDVVPAR